MLDAWLVTETIVTAMYAEVREHHANFLLVSGTFGPQVDPDSRARKELSTRLGVNNLFYPGQRLATLAAKEHFPFLDLAPPLQDYATRTKSLLHGFGKNLNEGHWNELGHKLVGELLAGEVCRLIE